jgi:L-iditol 2-dehydrogenase
MKALVKFGYEPGDVELRDVPAPAIEPGTVLVAPHSVGVCGSDIHMWQNNQSWPVKPDLVLGHEVAGRIVNVADDVTGWSVGDRVVLETAAEICGKCALCRTARYNLCPGRRGYGAVRDGSFSELVIAEPRVLHRIPDNVSFDDAAMTEPYCVAYNALVERADIQPGELVVVQGVGPIGVLCVQLAKLRGAGTIVALGTDIDAGRLETARGLGADHIVNVQQQDPMTVIAGLGDGLGADLVVDATGVSAAFAQSMQLVRPFGAIAKVGWGPRPLGMTLDPLVAKAATLYGCFSHTWATWERVLELFSSGRIDPGSVIGGSYPLADWHRAFHDMETGRNVKSVVTFAGASTTG